VILGSITASFAHGLLIIAAPESTDAHDSWDAATQAVHGGRDSIYVSVRQSASGLVQVECREGDGIERGLIRLYSGDLDLPSKKFIVYDPNETVLLTVLTDFEKVGVELYGDHEDESAKILVYIKPGPASV
jgi:hypothetical protein